MEGYYRVFLGSQEYLLNFWRSLFLCAVIVRGRWFCRCSRAWALPSMPSPGRTSGFFLLLVVMVLPLQVTLVPNFRISGALGLLDTQWALVLPAMFAPWAPSS